MKNIAIRFFVLCCVIVAFAFQAYSPQLPDATSAQISDLPTGYYAVLMESYGWDIDSSSFDTEYCTIYEPLSSTETFWSYSKFEHDPPTYVEFTIYVKEESDSEWDEVGSIRSDDANLTRSMSGDYMYYCWFSYDDLDPPSSPN